MPYPNEHSARLISKDTPHIRVGRTSGSGKGSVQGKKIPASIDIIWFVTMIEGKEVPRAQALRFKTTKWTAPEARAWLKSNDIKPILFEPAGDKNADNIDELENPTTINVDEMIREDFNDTGIQFNCLRFDVGRLPKAEITKDGFIKGSALVTKAGVFLYRNNDGTIRRELRHPDNIFKADSIDSMKMIPITNGHPPERIIDALNSKRLSIGYTGENVKREGDFIRAPITITDLNGVQAVQNGKNGFSLGYALDLLPEKGKYQGENYDCRQTNIRYNHLALVDESRIGDNIRLRMDSCEIVNDDNTDQISEPVQIIEKGKSFPNIIFNSIKEGGAMPMPQVNVDGIAYEASQEVINTLQKVTTENMDIKERLDVKDKEVQKITAERDEAKTNLDEANKKIENKDGFNKSVRARIDLEKSAARILNNDEMKDIEKKSDKDIRIAVIKNKHADINLDGKSDDYLNARFDTIIEGLGDNDNSNNDTADAAIKNQRQTMNNDRTGGGDNTRQDESQEAARKRMINRQTGAYKGESEKK